MEMSRYTWSVARHLHLYAFSERHCSAYSCLYSPPEVCPSEVRLIDLTREDPVALEAATALIPPARGGRKTHLSTLLRWGLKGVKGPTGAIVRLEIVRIGCRWFTSREALQRFSTALTPCLDTDATTPATPRMPARRQRTSEAAAKELERLGI